MSLDLESTVQKTRAKEAKRLLGNTFGQFYKRGELNGFMSGSVLMLAVIAAFKGEWIGVALVIVIAVAIFLKGHADARDLILAAIEKEPPPSLLPYREQR